MQTTWLEYLRFKANINAQQEANFILLMLLEQKV